MRNKYKIQYTFTAQADMRKIRYYILYQLKSPIAAERTIERIKEEAHSLNFMPYRYAPVDQEPWRSRGMHKLPVRKYTIFYTIDESTKTVEIQHIVYGARDIENIFPH